MQYARHPYYRGHDERFFFFGAPFVGGLLGGLIGGGLGVAAFARPRPFYPYPPPYPYGGFGGYGGFGYPGW